jgi:hypothetical protein
VIGEAGNHVQKQCPCVGAACIYLAGSADKSLYLKCQGCIDHLSHSDRDMPYMIRPCRDSLAGGRVARVVHPSIMLICL